ncbi:hypothetical protein [Chryseobacterium indoltheticum]|uniref:hypothetical protein n=1 Tax=Chryseobacterium indoltheticum TaxID=254 RepID=UPI003F49731D
MRRFNESRNKYYILILCNAPVIAFWGWLAITILFSLNYNKIQFMIWEPITSEELSLEITKAEKEMSSANFQFWNEIKLTPTKWTEQEFGDEGGGFWAIAKI